MSVFNSISVAVLIVLLVSGALAGLSAAGTDLLNPNTSKAEADRIRANTEHDAIMNKLTEEREKAKTDAEIASIQRQQESEQKRFEEEMKYIEQLYARKLTAYEHWIKVRDALLLMFGSALSLVIVIFVTAKSAIMLRSTSPAPLQIADSTNEAKQYWRRRREMARETEQWLRNINVIKTRMKAFRDPASMSKEKYDKSPLAGD